MSVVYDKSLLTLHLTHGKDRGEIAHANHHFDPRSTLCCRAARQRCQQNSSARRPGTAPDKPYGAVLSAFLTERVVAIDMSHWVLAAGGLEQGELEAMALYRQLTADMPAPT